MKKNKHFRPNFIFKDFPVFPKFYPWPYAVATWQEELAMPYGKAKG
jgi:hypothetical protein